MLHRIYTEAIHTHIDIFLIGINEVIVDQRIFRFQIKTVIRNRFPLSFIVIPVTTSRKPIMVVNIQRISCTIHNYLVASWIIIARNLGFQTFSTQFVQAFFTKIGCMVENYVLNNFHPLGMHGINQSLIINPIRFVPIVHRIKIRSMVTMIVIARIVLDNRSNPNSRESQCFNVV